MQAQLHGNLHHEATEHEGCIRPLARRRKWPCAQHTECLDHPIVLGNTRDGGPQQAAEWPRKCAQQTGLGWRSPTSHADDGPCQQGTSVEIDLRRLRGVQKGKKRMIIVEVSKTRVRPWTVANRRKRGLLFKQSHYPRSGKSHVFQSPRSVILLGQNGPVSLHGQRGGHRWLLFHRH